MTPYKQEPVIDSSLCPAVPPRHQLLVLFFNLLSCHMLLPQNSSYFFHSHTAFHTVSQICAIWTIYPITQMSSKWSCYILMAPQCHSPPKIIYCPVHVLGLHLLHWIMHVSSVPCFLRNKYCFIHPREQGAHQVLPYRKHQ